MRCEFSKHEWIAIKSMLPNKPHGGGLTSAAPAEYPSPKSS
jgi:hypothetical protein